MKEKSKMVFVFHFSEVKVVGSNVGNLDKLTNDRGHFKELLALLVTDGPEFV